MLLAQVILPRPSSIIYKYYNICHSFQSKMGVAFCSSQNSSQCSKTPQKVPINLSDKKKSRENNRDASYQQSIKQKTNINQEMIKKLSSRSRADFKKTVQTQKTIVCSQKQSETPKNQVSLPFSTKCNIDSYQCKRAFAIKQMGGCILVDHKANQNKYVIKTIKKSKLKYKILLQNEIIKQFQKNELLVQINEIFQNESQIYVVMQYLPKMDLYCNMKKIQWTQQILKLALAQIIVGIQSMHRKGIIYRVLKPQNVLITNDGHIKLTDYVLSKLYNQNDDSQQNYRWVKQYAAPQVIMGHYDFKADTWTIGALINQIVESTGQHEQNHQKYFIDINQAKHTKMQESKQQTNQPVIKMDYLFPGIGRQVDEEVSENSNFEYSKSQNLCYEDRDTSHFQIDQNQDCLHISLKDSMSKDLKNLISILLEEDPSRRPSLQQIKQHLFFSGIDWQAIRLRQNAPPLKDLDTDHTRYINWSDGQCMRKPDQYIRKGSYLQEYGQVANKKTQSLHLL